MKPITELHSKLNTPEGAKITSQIGRSGDPQKLTIKGNKHVQAMRRRNIDSIGK